MLRIKKIIQFIGEKLSIELDPECYGGKSGNMSGHFIDLYFNGKLLPSGTTLATLKYVLSIGQSKEIELKYLEKLEAPTI